MCIRRGEVSVWIHKLNFFEILFNHDLIFWAFERGQTVGDLLMGHCQANAQATCVGYQNLINLLIIIDLMLKIINIKSVGQLALRI
jgi:hypothetical protein